MKAVKEAANVLKSLGEDVEILDDEWLKGKLYYIEGYQFKASNNSNIVIESKFWSVAKALSYFTTIQLLIKMTKRTSKKLWKNIYT